MKSYSIAGQIFLLLALLSWFGWIITRFSGPILKVSYQGFQAFAVIALIFVIAISLSQLALTNAKGK